VSTATDLNKPTDEFFAKRGYICANTETFDRFSKHKKDLLGFIDRLAFSPTQNGEWGPIVALQITSLGNRGARLKKIRESPWSKIWCACGLRILLVLWDTRGKELTNVLIEEVTFSPASLPPLE